MQKCHPVLIKTAATAASVLISLTGSIVYSPTSFLLHHGLHLCFLREASGFLNEWKDADPDENTSELSFLKWTSKIWGLKSQQSGCIVRLFCGGVDCRKLFVAFLEQFCGVEAVAGPLSSECDSVLDLLAWQEWRYTLARRLIPCNCQWFWSCSWLAHTFPSWCWSLKLNQGSFIMHCDFLSSGSAVVFRKTVSSLDEVHVHKVNTH